MPVANRSGGARQGGPKKQKTGKASTCAWNDGGGTCKKRFSQPGSMAGIASVGAAARWSAGTQRRARKARHATSARRTGTTRNGGNVVVTYGQRGPGGEGVAEEGLDAVAAWCSEIEEGGGVCSDPVRLLPHGWLRLGVGRRRRAPTDGKPRLLLLLHSSYVNSSGLGNPNWLGFEPRGCGGAYKGGGRWDERRDRLLDAWRPSAVADMAARPPFPRRRPRVRVEE
jgi:hypothetical protein